MQSLTAYLFQYRDRPSCLIPHENVSSRSLAGWLSRIWIENRPFRKKINISVCEMHLEDATLAKTVFAKHQILSRASNVAFTSPVSPVYAWNSWDHDPPFCEKNSCIFWLRLSYGSPSIKEFLPYGSDVTSCKWAMMAAKMRLLHVVCRVLLFSIFEASVRALWARQKTKLVGESHSDSYLSVLLCLPTNNTKDYKYAW